ncbi:CDP-alcohol phosphatidyltransferase family protein [Streptomyces sp. NPDC046862]|uniref:CDP-alcohol phosphatidyltransferase family protein n=1 Tax=Streptomyces sp. NPDC046862 TaxID=3154603 RepID=UPI0034513AEC
MRRDIPDLAEVRRITQKKRDAWWTVLLVDPVATPLVRLTAKYTRITPNQLTWGAFLLGLASAACFAVGDWRWLVGGAVVYHLSFVLDCMDGKVARLTGQGSLFGAWLDFVFDRIRVAVCAVALMAGQYQRTDDELYIWLAAAVIGLDALRYINSLETFKIRHSMRKQIKARLREARHAEDDRELAFMEDLLRKNPEADIEQDLRKAVGAGSEGAGSEDAGSQEVANGPQKQPQVIDLHQEFRRRFPTYLRVRSFLLRHRVRAHLISGIEFQMGVFIVGPLLDAVAGAAIVSGGLLLVFELALVYKLLLSTRDFTRTIDSFTRDEVTRAA